MKRSRSHLAAALILAGLAVTACDSGPRDAAWYARRTQHMVGTLSGPLRVKSVEAEENVLVITVNGPENWRRGNPSFILTAFALDGFCDSPISKDYFGEGRRLRVDTLEDGQHLIRGQLSSRCRDPQSRIIVRS
jgi:hypothetical protein